MQDHLQEVIEKWDSIDDEIWAKVIVLERNRRVAKGQLISKEISFAVNSSKNERKNLPKIDPEVHSGQIFSNNLEEMKSWKISFEINSPLKPMPEHLWSPSMVAQMDLTDFE